MTRLTLGLTFQLTLTNPFIFTLKRTTGAAVSGGCLATTGSDLASCSLMFDWNLHLMSRRRPPRPSGTRPSVLCPRIDNYTLWGG